MLPFAACRWVGSHRECNHYFLDREELGLRSKGKKYVLHFGRPAHKRKAEGGKGSRDIEGEGAAEMGGGGDEYPSSLLNG